MLKYFLTLEKSKLEQLGEARIKEMVESECWTWPESEQSVAAEDVIVPPRGVTCINLI